MGKIGQAIGYKMPKGDEMDLGEAETPEEDTAEPGEEAGGEAGALAMKQFSRAATPEDKAKAMYSFMQACGVC